MLALAKNLRIALRQLRKAPGFTLTVVLTLALGIGATTAIFSLVEGILLRPLPFRDADRLVFLGDHLGNRLTTPGVTAREIETYAIASHAFSSMGAYAGAGSRRPAQCELVHHARRSTHPRPRFHPAGRSRASAIRRAQLRALAQPLSSRPPHPRQLHRPRPPTVHDHRRHAAQLRIPLADRAIRSGTTLGTSEPHS